jgi:hypothetical protein
MTLLHAAQLQAPSECYDLNEKVFLDFELEVMLEKLM